MARAAAGRAGEFRGGGGGGSGGDGKIRKPIKALVKVIKEYDIYSVEEDKNRAMISYLVNNGLVNRVEFDEPRLKKFLQSMYIPEDETFDENTFPKQLKHFHAIAVENSANNKKANDNEDGR